MATVRQLDVDLDDLDVAGGLHTLHVAEGSSRGDRRAGFRQLHEHHLSKVTLHQASKRWSGLLR